MALQAGLSQHLCKEKWSKLFSKMSLCRAERKPLISRVPKILLERNSVQCCVGVDRWSAQWCSSSQLAPLKLCRQYQSSPLAHRGELESLYLCAQADFRAVAGKLSIKKLISQGGSLGWRVV